MKFFLLLLPVWLLWVTPVYRFSGIRTKSAEPVKIGLLITDARSSAAQHAAEMATRKANASGGFNGRPFQLVVRTMEGPWGTGSKQAVDLIFEEEVVALLGSCDGRNAHLVEQACAKARVVFVSAWASDPTLSQAFVPWFFNCVPNDNQQAEKLIDAVYNKSKFSNVAVISDNGYDAKLSLQSFIKITGSKGKKTPLVLSYDDSEKDFSNLLEKILKAQTGCVVLFGQPTATLKLVNLIQQRKMKLPVFVSLSGLDERELQENSLGGYEGADLITPGHWFSPKGIAFRKEYQGKFGRLPGAGAAYVYDGTSLMIEAIKRAGSLEREAIQKSLTQIRYEGITGIIQFDDKGNRKGSCKLMVIKDGVPVEVKGSDF
jgi:branched-chain amino acid transport system substrate-binding protein